ncbi:MAG: hypothetical protein AB9866_18660 [Syntrophobacteraceae bacterium]
MTIDRHQGAGELSYTNINCSRNRCYDVLVNLLISLPILSAIINALSWLRFGVDLPLLDDWRNWNFGLTGSFDLKHLFVPAKGTLDPIGLALDSLATRSLNGNTIAYQFLSMVTVLSSVLWLQWHLLSVALKDRLLTASAFSFTLFMLQPGSYWGLQNLAYHQAIPVVCNLSAINLFTGEKWNDWKIPIVLMLGIISGMTCISGTLSILAIGAASLILSRFIKGSDQKPLVRGGLSLLITGVITSIPQAWVTAVFQEVTHRPDIPLASPFRADFWFYFLGEFGKSLLLPQHHPVLSLVITTIVLMISFSLLVRHLRQLRRSDLPPLSEARTGIISFLLVAMVIPYVLIVSAGRTTLRPPEITNLTDVFALPFSGSCFFWVALLWPWVAATGYQATMKCTFQRVGNLAGVLAAVLPMIILPLIISGGALQHSSYYRSVTKVRAAGVRCIESALQHFGPVFCPQVSPEELSSTIFFAKANGASFTRTINFATIPIGTCDPAPLFRFSNADPKDLIFDSIDPIDPLQNGYRYSAGFDPKIMFATGHPNEINYCAILEVSAIMRVTEPDEAQLFYRFPGQAAFSEENSQRVRLNAANGERVQISFQISNPNGLVDQLRFDPVIRAQRFDVMEMEIRCRGARPKQDPWSVHRQ